MILVCEDCRSSFHGSNDRIRLCAYCTMGLGPKPLAGNKLAEIISREGHEVMGRKCKCLAAIAQMNAWGVDGCRENIETIVDWLEEAAKEHTWKGKAMHIPGLRGAGRHYLRGLVQEAISMTESAKAETEN